METPPPPPPNKRPRPDESTTPGPDKPPIAATEFASDPGALLRFQNARQSTLLKERARTIAELRQQVEDLQLTFHQCLLERDQYAARWHQLAADVGSLGERLYSITLATDTSATGDVAAQDDVTADRVSAFMRRLIQVIIDQEQRIQAITMNITSAEGVEQGIRDLIAQQQQRLLDNDAALASLNTTRSSLVMETERSQRLQAQADSLIQALEQKSDDLNRALKRIDQLESGQVVSLTPKASADHTLTPAVAANPIDSQPVTPSGAPASVSDVETLKGELEDAKLLAESRLANENALQARIDQLQHSLSESEAQYAIAQGRAAQAELGKDLLLQQISDLKGDAQASKALRTTVETTFQTTLTSKTAQYLQTVQTLQQEAAVARQALADQQQQAEKNAAQLQVDIDAFKAKEHRLKELETLCKSLKSELDRRKARELQPSDAGPSEEDLNNALMTELDDVARQYDEMQEQNARLLEQIRSLEDVNTQLVADAARIQQQLGSAVTEKQLLADKEVRLVSLISRNNDMEAALKGQIASQTQVLDRLNEQVHVLTTLQEEYKESAAISAARLLELQESSQSQSAQLETRLRTNEQRVAQLANAEKMQRRAEEKLLTLQRQLSKSKQQGTESADVALERELDQYKRIVKCGVCKDTPKSVVISKCFHVFCRACVETRIKNRDRRCPACSKPFGQDDVHNIYLTH